MMNTGPPPSPLSQTTDLQISESINDISALSSNNNSEPASPPSLLQTESEIVEEQRWAAQLQAWTSQARAPGAVSRCGAATLLVCVFHRSSRLLIGWVIEQAGGVVAVAETAGRIGTDAMRHGSPRLGLAACSGLARRGSQGSLTTWEVASYTSWSLMR
jgi:hypothetical protein